MAIWFRPYTLEQVQRRGFNTMVEFIGIEIKEIGEDFLAGTMPVDHRTVQPMGILHGGASVVLAESLGSIAANLVVDPEAFYCIGLDINANHIRPVPAGNTVNGVAKPTHLGRTTQVWTIEMKNELGKLCCVSRLTMAVLPKKG